VFASLMGAVKSHLLGQISQPFTTWGGKYRNNM
jgi:hypothetical protein